MPRTRPTPKIGAPEPIAALNRVRIVETGEALVDIRDYCPGVSVAEKACPYLRRTVADMLNRAQKALPAGHVFKVGTALRTLGMQRGGWDGYFRKMQEEHPSWPLSSLRRATNKYFAPYDQPAPPGHCTGGAVDVGVMGPDGESLDMTSPTEGWQAAYTWSERISPEARANRLLMVEAMLGAGFSNCRDEFWHYSYGDSAWAVRVGASECPYGLVEPPVAVEARFEGAAAGSISRLADGAWMCSPVATDAGPALRVALLWSAGKPLTVLAPAEAGAPRVQRDGGEWEPVAADTAGRLLRITLTPDTDRLYLELRPGDRTIDVGDANEGAASR